MYFWRGNNPWLRASDWFAAVGTHFRDVFSYADTCKHTDVVPSRELLRTIIFDYGN